jgi:hypothetical protein
MLPTELTQPLQLAAMDGAVDPARYYAAVGRAA